MAFVSKIVKRGFASSITHKNKIQEVVIIGGGLMGSGIAQVAAQTGHKVTMVDVNQEILDKSNARISESIKRVAKKKFKDDEAGAKNFIDSSLGLMNVATSANDTLACSGYHQEEDTCKPTCSRGGCDHGTCTEPNVCSCKAGFSGA